MSKISIPKTLLVCIQKERGLSCFPIIKKKKDRKDYLNTPHHRKIISNTMKQFWASMTPAQKKKFCAKRAKSLKKTLKKLSPEEQKARMEKSARKGIRERLSTPEGRAAWGNRARKNLEKINNVVIKDLPRVNDYSGVITMSQMQELHQ